jgi:menaquinone-specific isochorismate synthase
VESLEHLVARSVVVEGPIDLKALAVDEGWLFSGTEESIAATGIAATIPVEGGLRSLEEVSISKLLSTIEHFDTAGIGNKGLRAFGTLPFSPTAPAQLVVPSLIVQRHPDGSWVATSIAEQDTMPTIARAQDEVDLEAASPKVRAAVALPTPSGYEEAVRAATKIMENSELRKVVLGRRLTVSLDRPFDVSQALSRLSAREPLCTLYLVPTSRGRFFGASPELIVAKEGTAFRSHPLAGSVAIDGSDGDAAREQALEASEKNQQEHRYVVQDIVQRLGWLATSVEADAQPTLMVLRSIAHLGTKITGTTAPWPSGPDALQLAAAIAPTPAVGGSPSELALTTIAELEGFDRAEWAGIAGSVDACGDGRFVLAIRGATADGAKLILHAGCGIVQASDPTEELDEATFKLRAVLDVILPGAAEQLFAALSGRVSAESRDA